MALAFDVDRNLFGRAQIDRIAEHYLAALGAIAADPDAIWSTVSLHSPSERERLIEGFNATEHRYSRDLLMHAGFERRARMRPEALAAICGDERWSYGELNARANRIAHRLLSDGLGAGERVGICLQRGLSMLSAVLGVLKAGGAYVPLDPDYPEARLREMLLDSDPVAVLSETGLLVLPALQEQSMPVLAVDAVQAWCSQPSHDPGLSGRSAEDLAYVIYTSGSTGRPKGVMVQHRPAVNLFEWAQETFGIGERDRVLFTTSLSFDLSVYDMFGVLWCGGSVHVARREEVRDPAQLVSLLREGGITLWDSAPAVFGSLLPFLGDGEVSSSLRLAFFSGDWIGLELPDAVRRSFPGCEVIALGGATEATVWSNYHRVGRVEPHWKSIPYGRPIWNARYYVLDARGEPSPVGVPGDLHIGGECLAQGYWNRAELTRERFVADPFVPGARMYRTGDRARYGPDGTLEFLGRVDGQVKVRGFRVELGEIESALQGCEGVRESVVLACADGSGGQRLVAYCVMHADARWDVSWLRGALQARLPAYMVPSAYVEMDGWPLTPNGKLDRGGLPLPGEEAVGRRAYASPEGALEESLAEIWRELLGLERIGRHDHFFELGGHSLLAVQLATRIRERCRVEPAMNALVQAPVLEAMAAVIREAQFEAFMGGDADTLARDFDELSKEELLALLAQEENTP